jgi:hypothetical protein
MNKFCTCAADGCQENKNKLKCLQQVAVCGVVQDQLKENIEQICDGKEDVCHDILKVANNWEDIDMTFYNLTAKLELECESDICSDIQIFPGTLRRKAEAAIVNFCFNGSDPSSNASTPAFWEPLDGDETWSLHKVFSTLAVARGAAPVTQQESDAIAVRLTSALGRLGVYPAEFLASNVADIYLGGNKPDVTYPEGTWVQELMKLGEMCPVLSAKVEAAIDDFCDDRMGATPESFTCTVLSSIPWTTVPVSRNDGPVLNYINSTVKPDLERLAAKVKDWCGMSGLGGVARNHTGWHADACKAVREFARDELARSFDLLVAKIDELSDYDVASAVANAEAWLTCSLGESEWPVPAHGYYFPMVWTDEWMDLSADDSDAFKSSVLRTQNTSDAIYFWCLGLSLLCLLLALSVAVSRRLTKLDYMSSERLLPSELVANRFESPGGFLSAEYYALDDDPGAALHSGHGGLSGVGTANTAPHQGEGASSEEAGDVASFGKGGGISGAGRVSQSDGRRRAMSRDASTYEFDAEGEIISVIGNGAREGNEGGQEQRQRGASSTRVARLSHRVGEGSLAMKELESTWV